MAAALGRALDRRSGLKGLAAGLAATLVGAGSGDVIAKPGPKPQGPCGPKAIDNVCKSGKDCCTGICNKKNNKCRCVSRGKKCTEDRNCCSRGKQRLSCIDRVCQAGGSGEIPTGAPCQPGQVCKNAAATCTTYTNGAPTGTYCLLPTGSPCGATDGFCTSQFCNGGTCQPCTVCSDSAACAHNTIGGAVAAASAGAVIGIAAGTYDTYLTIETDNLTLRRCGGPDAGSVLWTQDAGDGESLDLEETGISAFTVKGIDFMAAYQAMIILATGASDKRLTLTVEGCTFTGRHNISTDYYAPAITTNDYTNITITDTTFTDFIADSYSGAAFSSNGDITDRNIVIMTNVTATGCSSGYQGGAFDIRKATATLTNCTITGNTASMAGGGINLDGGGTVTLVNCTISGNATTSTVAEDGVGGGVSVRDNGGNIPADITKLVIQGTTTITGNTASGPNASNGGGVASLNGGLIEGGSLTNITGNTPSDQNCTLETGGTFSTVSCATWT
jgi:parallel beta-helix repeat protein